MLVHVDLEMLSVPGEVGLLTNFNPVLEPPPVEGGALESPTGLVSMDHTSRAVHYLQ